MQKKRRGDERHPTASVHAVESSDTSVGDSDDPPVNTVVSPDPCGLGGRSTD
jgi:hypothetical protein